MDRRLHVLVVEDNPDLVDYYRTLLEIEDFQVSAAYGPYEVEKIIRLLRPDAIIADVMMPSGDEGLRMLEALKADPELASIPVVICTGRTRDAERDRAMALGAAAYFTKPFDRVELVDTLRRLAGGAVSP